MGQFSVVFLGGSKRVRRVWAFVQGIRQGGGIKETAQESPLARATRDNGTRDGGEGAGGYPTSRPVENSFKLSYGKGGGEAQAKRGLNRGTHRGCSDMGPDLAGGGE